MSVNSKIPSIFDSSSNNNSIIRRNIQISDNSDIPLTQTNTVLGIREHLVGASHPPVICRPLIFDLPTSALHSLWIFSNKFELLGFECLNAICCTDNSNLQSLEQIHKLCCVEVERSKIDGG